MVILLWRLMSISNGGAQYIRLYRDCQEDNLNITDKGRFQKKKMEISIFGLNPPPLPKMEKWNKKNFISLSVGIFTPNWYQRWKIKKKIYGPPS